MVRHDLESLAGGEKLVVPVKVAIIRLHFEKASELWAFAAFLAVG